MQRAEIDPAEAGGAAFARALKRLVVPRPIAWVSTVSADGVENLAPHSFFTMASEQPAIAQFTSIGDKDSLKNVRETGEFVICMASEPQFEQINASATDYPRELSEFEQVGIEREPSAAVRPPRVAESPSALECRLVDTIEIGGGVVVFGEVVHAAVDQRVMVDGRPDVELLEPLARLGGNQWALIGEIREIRRVPYQG